MSAQDRPIVCDLNAIPTTERERHQRLAMAIMEAVQERIPLADGYAFRLPFAMWDEIAAWLPLERLCCPFFTFVLRIEPAGAVRLELTGPDGVKGLIEQEMG